MAKRDKNYSIKMDGMNFALKHVKEHGIESLEKEIKQRGFLGSPLIYDSKEIDGFWEFLSKNLYATMTCVISITLHDQFGFGKARLQKFRDAFEKATMDALDLDWLGNHYVTLEDYAIHLNKEYDLGLDVERIGACEQSQKNPNARKTDIDRVLKELKENGFEDAARFLEKKM